MPVKLFVDCHAFDQELRQGITTYLAGLYRAAVNLDSPVEFYFASCSPKQLEPVFGTGKNVHYLQCRSHGRVRRLLLEYPALLEREKMDYAHFQYVVPFRKTCREIVTLHDILFCDFPEQFSRKYRWSRSLLFRQSARRANLLLTVSGYSKQRIIRQWRIPPEKIKLIPDAVSEEWAVPLSGELPPAAGRPFSRYILYVSRMEPRKNHGLLLRIWRELRLREKGIGLVFIGAPAERCPVLEAERKRLPAEDAPFFVTESCVSFPELRRWYAGASLFVFPSAAEGFGIPPLEAGMSGVPCLCSDRTAMADFGFFGSGLFDPEDPELLKEKIAGFFQGTLVLPDAETIRREIRRRFSWKRSAEMLLSLITDGTAAVKHSR